MVAAGEIPVDRCGRNVPPTVRLDAQASRAVLSFQSRIPEDPRRLTPPVSAAAMQTPL